MDFYYKSASPPCCSVLVTAKTVGVELNKIFLDLKSGDHLKPEFLKLNPQHTVPTLNDNGFVVWESRAIMIYLAEQYDKTDSLYPKCPQKRALINQRMFFDIGTLTQSFADYYYPQLFAHQPAIPDNFDKMEAAFDLLNTFLDGQLYSAGDSLTLADIALVATVSMYDAASFEINKYSNVSRWYKLVASVVPGFDIIQQGMAEFKQFFN